MQKVKKDLNKLENEFLTIEEFCSYAGIKYEQVTHLIFGWYSWKYFKIINLKTGSLYT